MTTDPTCKPDLHVPDWTAALVDSRLLLGGYTVSDGERVLANLARCILAAHEERERLTAERDQMRDAAAEWEEESGNWRDQFNTERERARVAELRVCGLEQDIRGRIIEHIDAALAQAPRPAPTETAAAEPSSEPAPKRDARGVMRGPDALARAAAAASPEPAKVRDESDLHPTRADFEIIPEYMPPYPRPETRPIVAVRYLRRNWGMLRYSKGPRQGHFLDTYGDDYQTIALAEDAIAMVLRDGTHTTNCPLNRPAPPEPPPVEWVDECADVGGVRLHVWQSEFQPKRWFADVMVGSRVRISANADDESEAKRLAIALAQEMARC